MAFLDTIVGVSERVFTLLQRGRSLVLQGLTPLDAAIRLLHGQQGLPPLWLRRHTGPLRYYLSSARELRGIIEAKGLIQPTDCVLDIGCGTGVMAVECARLLGVTGRYVGFDVHRPSIRWCRKAFALDSRFEFHEAMIASPYSDGQLPPPTTYRFPLPDHTAGFVLAKSVFTHLLEPAARHYLEEVRRTLSPGRIALVTAFLYSHTSRTGRGRSASFRFADLQSVVRWRWKARPEAAIAYELEHFTAMVRDAQLEIAWLSPGFWPGEGDPPRGQDLLFLRPRLGRAC